MSYAKKLERLKKNWKDAKPATGGGQLPKGNYQLEIKKAQLQESKAAFNKGNIQVVYSLVVATGPLKGRKASIFVDLESTGKNKQGETVAPSGMEIFKGHLENLQVDMPKDLSEKSIKEVLASLIGTIFNGAAVQNAKGYTNIYINDLVHAADAEDEDEDEDEDEEDTEEDEDEEDEDEDDEEEDDDEEDEEDDDEEEVEVKPSPKKKASKKAAPKKAAKKASKKEEDAEEEDDDDDWDIDLDD